MRRRRRGEREAVYDIPSPVQRHRSSTTSSSTKYILLNRIRSSHDVTYRSNVVNSIYRAAAIIRVKLSLIVGLGEQAIDSRMNE